MNLSIVAQLFGHRDRDVLEVVRRLLRQFLWCELFGDGGEVLQIGEEHGHEPLLDVGHQRGLPVSINSRTSPTGTNTENDRRAFSSRVVAL